MGDDRVKAPFTLIELSAVTSLASAILFCAIYIALSITDANRSLDLAHQEVLAHLLVQDRLSSLFATSQALTFPNAFTCTFLATDILDPDPAYSTPHPITITHHDHRLVLTIKDRPETLLEGVKSLSWRHIAPAAPCYSSLVLTVTPTSKKHPKLEFAFPLAP